MTEERRKVYTAQQNQKTVPAECAIMSYSHSSIYISTQPNSRSDGLDRIPSPSLKGTSSAFLSDGRSLSTSPRGVGMHILLVEDGGGRRLLRGFLSYGRTPKTQKKESIDSVETAMLVDSSRRSNGQRLCLCPLGLRGRSVLFYWDRRDGVQATFHELENLVEYTVTRLARQGVYCMRCREM